MLNSVLVLFSGHKTFLREKMDIKSLDKQEGLNLLESISPEAAQHGLGSLELLSHKLDV